jgi:hypothetical protein
MPLTIHNYEAYFLDYHEGRLSAEECHALSAFLEAHPWLREEFNGLGSGFPQLRPDTGISLGNKDFLKRQTHEEEKASDEYRLIAMAEGDLSAGESEALIKQMADNADLKKQYHQYLAARMTADPGLVFPGKDCLKKTPALFLLRLKSLAAAAVILLALGLSYLLFFVNKPASIETYSLEKLASIGPVMESQATPVLRLQTRELPPLAGPAEKRQTDQPEKLAMLQTTKIQGHSAPKTMGINLAYRNELFASGGWETNLPAAHIEGTKDKSLAGKLIAGLFGKVTQVFSADDHRYQTKNKDGFTIWDLADLGLRGINTLGDHRHSLIREYDENGAVNGIIILSE